MDKTPKWKILFDRFFRPEKEPTPAAMMELMQAIYAALADKESADKEKTKDCVICRICGQPIELEETSTDENRRTIHADCYAKETTSVRQRGSDEKTQDAA